MIKFFRRIRQKLLSENKFSQYLLYALGEIFLVVIGILIALSINNWNEGRKNHLSEIQLVNNIVEDLSLDLAHFERSSNELENQLRVVDGMIARALDDNQELDYDTIGLVRYSSDFRPITQRNHAESVSKLVNEFVRDNLQNYFLAEDQVLDLFKEYEAIIHGEVRPYLREVGMHNLAMVRERDLNIRAPVLLKAEVLEEQIPEVKFQQLLFERRLKTETFKLLLDQLMAENRALSETLKSITTE